MRSNSASVAAKLAAGALVLWALTWAHVEVLAAGPTYAGWLLPLDHLFDLSLVLGLVAVGTGLGLRLLDRMGPTLPGPAESLCFGAATGLAVLSTGILILGLVGGLGGAALAGLVLALAALTHRELARMPLLLAETLRGLAPGERGRPGSGHVAAAVVVTSLVGLFLVAFALAPPADWDALMYHLEVPARWLDQGRVHLPADNLHATVTGLLHALYVPLLAAGSSAGPAVLNALLAMILALAVGAAGVRLFGTRTGSLAGILLWGTTSILLVAITPRVDTSLALYVFLAHYAMLLALPQRETPARQRAGADSGADAPGPASEDHDNDAPDRWVDSAPSGQHDTVLWIGLAALLLGAAVGVKYNALAYALALAPLALWVLVRNGGGTGSLVRATLTCALVGVAAMAPWLLKNVVLVGAPLYPYLTERMAEPWLNNLFPGGSAAAAVAPEVLRSLRSVRAPFDLWATFFDPARLSVEAEAPFYAANRAFLLLPLWLLFLRGRVGWLVAPCLAYLALIVVPFGQTNLRYLIPAAPALTLGVSWILVRSSDRWLPARAGPWLVAAVAVLTLWPTARLMGTWLSESAALGHLAGAASARSYLASHPDPGVRMYTPVVAHLNDDAVGGEAVLMLFEARGYPVDVPVLQDSKISNWPILAAALDMDPGGCLTEAPFERVLLATGVLGYYRRRGLDMERLRWSEFDAFQERCLEVTWQAPGYVLFRRR